MNKKGFTLVELIVVISIMAVVALIATPNIIELVNNSKKEQILADGKKFLTDVKYKTKLIEYKELLPSNNSCSEICANNPYFMEILDKDPDGNLYNKSDCCVKICINSNITTYSIKLVSVDETNMKVRGISNDDYVVDYVLEENLTKNSVVKFK